MAKKRLRGEVTAYLSLIFILLVTFIGGVMESASIQLAKNYRRADMNRAMECVFAEYQKELLEEYDLFALDGSYETGQYAKQNIEDRLSYYGAGNMEHKVVKIQFLTDRGCRGFCDQISEYMKHRHGEDVMKDMLGMTSVWEIEKEQAEERKEEERAYRDHMAGLLSENAGALPGEGNLFTHVEQLRQAPLLTLVMPRDRAVSGKQMEALSVLSSRDRNMGYGEFEDAAGEDENLFSLLLGEYLLEHFTRFTDMGCLGVMDYELEYILAGKSSDQENLEAVLEKMLQFRFVANYDYIKTDSEMAAKVQETVLALGKDAENPGITEALISGILLGWAYGESIIDLRALLNGNKVPLTKMKESWQLQLSQLLMLGTDVDYNEGRNDENGLDYSDYLRMLLYLEEKDKVALRSLDVIEQNLRKIHGQTYFRADLCISRLEVQSVCRLRRGICYQFKTYYGYR